MPRISRRVAEVWLFKSEFESAVRGSIVRRYRWDQAEVLRRLQHTTQSELRSAMNGGQIWYEHGKGHFLYEPPKPVRAVPGTIDGPAVYFV